MKYVLLLCLLFASLAHAQINDKEIQDNIKKLDTMNAQLNESMQRSMHAIDSMNMARTNEQMARNLDSFMAARKEQERKNMQSMYIRLAFFAVMLAVFIVGIIRKRKAAAKTK